MWQTRAPAPPAPAPAPAGEDGLLAKIIPVLSVFTMVMTVPQVWSVWVDGETAGVSLLSWGAYLLSGVLWFFYGLGKGDRKIYVACVGWILLDAAVVAGVLWRG
jgi:uncharacterized protein with PQ loop repeat